MKEHHKKIELEKNIKTLNELINAIENYVNNMDTKQAIKSIKDQILAYEDDRNIVQ